jgi:hypothetical protein
VSNRYVILTGGKNNAGDFLIKHRAGKLFAALRPDREIVDLDGWLALDAEALELVNDSAALILMGGPALQEHMYPRVYPLVPKLNAIKVPIVAMGIGWKSARGEWEDTYTYPLAPDTLRLLDRIRDSGSLSSVRDFHTLNVLGARGYDNYLMTGCPAYYDLPSIGARVPPLDTIRKVAFSLGVSFVRSASMERLMKEQVLLMKEHFKDSRFEVVFHHSLDPDKFLRVYAGSKRHNVRHNAFAKWLEGHGIPYVDIAGSAENLIAYYESVDLHVGYRVHAHIFMASQSKLSVLITEDGRGKATRDVIGGMVVDGYQRFRSGLAFALPLLRHASLDRYVANESSAHEIIRLTEYESASDGQRTGASRKVIDHNFQQMQRFLAQLP